MFNLLNIVEWLCEAGQVAGTNSSRSGVGAAQADRTDTGRTEERRHQPAVGHPQEQLFLHRQQARARGLSDPGNAASNRYKIGLTPVALAHGALREVGIRTVAEPALYKLTNQTGLSAGIGVLQKGRVLLVDRVEGPRFVDRAIQGCGANRTTRTFRVREQRDIGRELPAHSTALGKVFLAFSPATSARRDLKAGLARSTATTIVSKKRFLAELDLVRERRYAVADGEAYSDLRALSVPIFDGDNEVRAAVSVNGDPNEPVWDDLVGLVRTVEDAARDIARRATTLALGPMR